MDSALKRVVVSALRDLGFGGSFPHLRRVAETVDLVTFQFDRNGGGFVIEVAEGNKDGFTTHWGEHIPAKKLKAWDLHPNDRKRIRPGAECSTDSWFRYDQNDSCEKLAHHALELLLKELKPNHVVQPTR
jgi:hypothetical protein